MTDWYEVEQARSFKELLGYWEAPPPLRVLSREDELLTLQLKRGNEGATVCGTACAARGRRCGKSKKPTAPRMHQRRSVTSGVGGRRGPEPNKG